MQSAIPNTTSMSCSTKSTVRFSSRAIRLISSTAVLVSRGRDAGRRLVQQQQAGVDGERRRRSRASAGRRARARSPASDAKSLEADALEELLGRARGPLSGASRTSRRVASADGRAGRLSRSSSVESVQKRFVCWNERPIAAFDELPWRHAGDVLALEEDLARVRLEQAGDEVEERRLAGAVRADDRVDRALAAP